VKQSLITEFADRGDHREAHFDLRLVPKGDRS
jgi:hypothetical protein